MHGHCTYTVHALLVAAARSKGTSTSRTRRPRQSFTATLHATITRRCVQKVGLPTYAAYTQNFENCEQQKRQPQGVPVLQIRRFLHVVELLTTTQ